MKKKVTLISLCLWSILSISCQSSLTHEATSSGFNHIWPLPEDSIYQVHTKWINQDNQVMTLEKLRGKYVAISMVYMSCKYACPLTVMHMKELQKRLPSQFVSKMIFVLVSFDPTRDTPDVMKAYAEKNSLDLGKWKFVTNTDESSLREFASLIDFKYKKLDDGEYEHSFGIALLNPEGRLLGSTIGSAMAEQDLVELLQADAK